MRLPQYIRAHLDRIAAEWESFARTLMPAGTALSESELRDHVPDLLEAIATDIEAERTAEEEHQRARGRAAGPASAITRFARDHAQTRLDQGYDVRAMGAEYRALRETVLRSWMDGRQAGAEDWVDQYRFGQGIDQAWIEATVWYGQQLDLARDFVLGALGHDLRNPLGAVQMAAQLLLRDPGLSAESVDAARRVLSSSARMRELVDQLLDVTRLRLGHKLPVNYAPSSVADVLHETIDELRAYHAALDLRLDCKGDLIGEWDRHRLAQMFSNVIANAVEHGEPQRPVTVEAHGSAQAVTVTIHNEGAVIPADQLERLFQARVLTSPGRLHPAPPSERLGLGLPIAREVAAAHGGRIDVTSSAEAGTRFEVTLPKRPPA